MASIYFSRTILFSVKVPVLSVQRISIDPKFSIEVISFTKTSFLASRLLPLDRLTLTIIGNILGVMPTATDNANKRASLKFFLIRPSTIMTKRQTSTIYLINSFEILLIP